MEILDTNKSTDGTQLNAQSIAFILETAKWAKFLSIIGFIMIGLMVLGGIFMGTLFASFPMGRVFGGGPILLIVVYLLMALLYFFPVYYLYKAAVGLKNGINSGSEHELTTGFENLKSHYKFVGILMIIILSIYALFFIIAMLGGLMMAGR